MRGEGKATSLREGGGGVSFGRKGEDVLFSEGRRKVFSFQEEGGRCSLFGRKGEGVLFPVGRGLLSFIWEEGVLDIVTCRERDTSRGRGRMISLWEEGGGVSFGRKGDDVPFVGGRGGWL